MNGNDTNVIDRIKSIIGEGPKDCKHERDGIRPIEDQNMWHLENSHLQNERYWSEQDAAFVELRERAKEFRCFGCGEERTIKTGEKTGNVRWKEDMDTDEIREMREDANCGSFYNGRLWWEDNVWDGDAEDVATQMDWIRDIGYQGWKNGSVNSGTNQNGEEL